SLPPPLPNFSIPRLRGGSGWGLSGPRPLATEPGTGTDHSSLLARAAGVIDPGRPAQDPSLVGVGESRAASPVDRDRDRVGQVAPVLLEWVNQMSNTVGPARLSGKTEYTLPPTPGVPESSTARVAKISSVLVLMGPS